MWAVERLNSLSRLGHHLFNIFLLSRLSTLKNKSFSNARFAVHNLMEQPLTDKFDLLSVPKSWNI
jgi:hypothetical protein